MVSNVGQLLSLITVFGSVRGSRRSPPGRGVGPAARDGPVSLRALPNVGRPAAWWAGVPWWGVPGFAGSLIAFCAATRFPDRSYSC
jgi:hypothetical protein